MKTATAKAIVEKFCGEEIDIMDNWEDHHGHNVVCARDSLPDRTFYYCVDTKKREVKKVNSRKIS